MKQTVGEKMSKKHDQRLTDPGDHIKSVMYNQGPRRQDTEDGAEKKLAHMFKM